MAKRYSEVVLWNRELHDKCMAFARKNYGPEVYRDDTQIVDGEKTVGQWITEVKTKTLVLVDITDLKKVLGEEQ